MFGMYVWNIIGATFTFIALVGMMWRSVGCFDQDKFVHDVPKFTILFCAIHMIPILLKFNESEVNENIVYSFTITALTLSLAMHTRGESFIFISSYASSILFSTFTFFPFEFVLSHGKLMKYPINVS